MTNPFEHPDDRALFEAATFEMMASGLDDVLADMSAAQVKAGVAFLLEERNSPQGRALAVAVIELWRETHRQTA